MEPNELRNLTKYRKNSIFPFILFALNVNALSEGGRFPVSLLLYHIELEIDLWSRTTSYVSSSFTKRKFSSGEKMRPGNNRKDFRKKICSWLCGYTCSKKLSLYSAVCVEENHTLYKRKLFIQNVYN